MNLQKLIASTNWIVASKAEESHSLDSEILVSREAVFEKQELIKTYFIVNFATPKSVKSKNKTEYLSGSCICKRELINSSNLFRIKSISYFSEKNCKGKRLFSFFYPTQQWESSSASFQKALNEFMRNHSKK
jgi:hypothetical protein